MSTCPACGHEYPVKSNFCPECGAAISERMTVPREERKVVTVLFADLVGFTSRSEQLDPEDVRAFLSPYYARLRSELERFGGTVEKFIGDAVMALFGAPVAHEDDPERAVRAALAIRDWVMEQDAGLQLRIAVNTGEVLVTLGARPSHGEGMASGDVVNTTARLQTAAPVNGILVGETTYRATSPAITYRAAQPVVAKGKAEPVAAWVALEAHSRFGVDLAAARSPLVGRTPELAALSDALARAWRNSSPQLVTLVGVPGIGKSRLVAELFANLERAHGEPVFWRQGRSLPYGDGITFWALAEMVKAQAGILETDSPEQAAEKLHASVIAMIPEAVDAGWIEGHLRPLAGLDAELGTAGGGRDAAFTAWRRFFESLADVHPLVLVFEDLHWAGDDLLDFIEHVIDWASGVPILVICTARPELYERRSGWGGGARGATTLSLAPLSDMETAELIGNVGDSPVMAVETRQALLSRAAGNPLYAEQYVRMLAERGEAKELPLPETVQGIVAARLDALPVEEKSLLQHAAVMGKVFWLGAVVHADGFERRTAELRLHDLERKDFVQRARRSSVADEAEYSFLHVLVRDVAYGQIPRGERAEQHRRAAEWIASLGRLEDHAELLAHHYLSALDLGRATGHAAEPSLAERALKSLRAAGDRAVSLNANPTAAGYYQSAVEMAPPESAERAQLLFSLGRARFAAGDVEPDLLLAARNELRACGDAEATAEAEATLAELYRRRGDGDAALEHLNAARDLLDAQGSPTRVTAYVMTEVSRSLMLAARSEEAIDVGRRALDLAARLGLDNLRAHALSTIGMSRVDLDELAGLADIEQSVALAMESGAPDVMCRTQHNLGSTLWMLGQQLARAAELMDEAGETAARFGRAEGERFARGVRVLSRFGLGRWHEALAGADQFLAEVEAGSPHYAAAWLYHVRAEIRLSRDDVAGALLDVEQALDLARRAKDPQILYRTDARCAFVLREAGQPGRAAGLAEEFLAELRTGRGVSTAVQALHVLAWTVSAQGRGQELIEALPQADIPWIHAARSFAAGDLGAAADICSAMGVLGEEARDRLWLAEALVKQNRRPEAEVHLQRALDFYRSVGATRYIRMGEALRDAEAQSASDR